VSPAFDPNNPFAQTWEDHIHGEGFKDIADSISYQKRYVAHTYMSSKCDVSTIVKRIEANPENSVSFESYLLKAAAKAFKIVAEEQASIARVTSAGTQLYPNADELGLESLGNTAVNEDVRSFSPQSPATGLTVTQIEHSLESLPIATPGSLMSLHFTLP